MTLATKRHTMRLSGVVAIAAIVAVLVGIVSASKETQRVELLVSRLADARPENVADTIKQLDQAGPSAVEALAAHAIQEGAPDWPGLALIRLTGTAHEPTLDWLLGADLHELFAVQQTLSHGLPESFARQLKEVLQDRDANPVALRNALCILSFASDEKIALEQDVARKIASLVATKKPQRQLASYLDNSSSALKKPLMRLFDGGNQANAENAAEWLLALASDDEAVLVRLATERGDEHFARIVDLLPSSPVVERMLRGTLDRNAEQFISREGTFEEKEIAVCRAVRAAVGLIRAGQGESVWPLLLSNDDPRIRARLISRAAFLLDDPRPIVDRLLTTESNSRLRGALLLMLSRFDSESASTRLRESVLEATHRWFVDDSDSNVHSAARCLLSSWGESGATDRLAEAIVPKEHCGAGGWLVDPTCGTTMVRIDVDDFMMGTENPPYPSERLHRRRVSRSILLGTTEITFEQFQKFVHASGEDVVGPLASAPRASDSPQMYVTWHHAASYCNWLSSQAGIEKEQWCYDVTAGGKARAVETALQRTGYRLPTEAEWEFACRAGTSTKYFHGETPEFLADYGWYGKSPADAQPVGKLLPNEYGLFDMYGNALEWCHGFPASYSDPRAKRGSLTQRRAQRGGHIAQPKPELVRSAIRYSDLPGTSNPTYGFRIARTIYP